ncbi:unnamed protein product [Moneuplotes crassus]|uniref:Zinc finger Mcm10/DnaG-type domain-containing protein n=1 Tax=Euplotes crassus TaxID=5936 RepID=A0AAD1XA08_EUPCR|nr:unnamed protein product [Moneuplotes crassus]
MEDQPAFNLRGDQKDLENPFSEEDLNDLEDVVEEQWEPYQGEPLDNGPNTKDLVNNPMDSSQNPQGENQNGDAAQVQPYEGDSIGKETEQEKMLRELAEKKKEMEENKRQEYIEKQRKKREYENDNIADLDIKYKTRLIKEEEIREQAKGLKFVPLKCIERVAKAPDTNLEEYFTMGIISGKAIVPMKSRPNEKFYSLTFTDLNRCDDVIALLERSKTIYKNELAAYKKFNITKGGYKTVDWLIFKSSGLKFMDFEVGDVVAVLKPTVFQNNDSPQCKFGIKNVSNFLRVGKSKYFKLCKDKNCGEFVNAKEFHLCQKHQDKEIKFTRQEIQANRAFCRTDIAYDHESRASKEANRRKIAKMGFVRSSDMEITNYSKPLKPAPFRDFTVREMPPPPVMTEEQKKKEEKVVLTEEQKQEKKREFKRKMKEQNQKAEEKLSRLFKSRNMKSAEAQLHKKVKTKERTFINNIHAPHKENKKPNFVTMEEEDDNIDISAYAHLLKKTPEEPKKPKFDIKKGMSLSGLMKQKK